MAEWAKEKGGNMDLIILFALKLLDTTLSTLKNIFLIKGMFFLSASCSTFAMYFYLTMLTNLNKNSTNLAIAVVCLSVFVGSYFPQVVVERREKDKVYVFEILPYENAVGKQLADELKELAYIVHPYKGYNEEKQEVLCSKVFSKTKKDSIIIENIIEGLCTYSITETIEMKQSCIKKEGVMNEYS
jgi:uncharacterized protein YebE (UPF0316 family)